MKKLDSIVASILIGLILMFCCTFQYVTKTNVTFTVIEKERVTERRGDSISSKYLIFTDSEVFQNTDSIFYFKFNSSDIYVKLKKDHTYEAVVYGWRVPFLSMYRNIVKIVD